MAINRLKELEGEMKKCFRCSLCKMVPLPVANNSKYSDCCPANHEHHFHGYSGSGKSIMALSLVADRIKTDQALADITYACTSCGYCDVACKFIMDAERNYINIALREHIVDEGVGLAVHNEIIKKIKSNRQDDSQNKSKNEISNILKKAGLKTLPQEKADVLLFAGCYDKQSAETAYKLAVILKHAGIDAGIMLDDEPQTGSYAYMTGYRDVFKETAENCVKKINDLNVSTVVVVSGMDLGMLRSKFAEYATPPKAEVLHATEYLAKLIKEEKLKLNTAINKKVTYHDPCYLGRQSEPPVVWNGEIKITHGCMPYADPPKKYNMGVNGVYRAPREILKSIKGIEFTEMFRIKEYAFCCGGGGGVPNAYPEMAKKTAMYRIEEARDCGAEYIVTACHQCKKTLSDAQDSKTLAPVLDIIDVVFEAAGLNK